MRGNNTYRDLIVWQKSMDLVEEVYRITRLLPDEENYVLASQMRRSVISIPSNIAEGQSRKGDKEFSNFLSFAIGSKSELETQLLICLKLGYFSEKEIEKSMSLCDEISKMIYALTDRLEKIKE